MPHEGTLYLEMETKWHPLYKALPLELKNKTKKRLVLKSSKCAVTATYWIVLYLLLLFFNTLNCRNFLVLSPLIFFIFHNYKMRQSCKMWRDCSEAELHMVGVFLSKDPYTLCIDSHLAGALHVTPVRWVW